MDYELVTNIGYVGAVVFALLTIFLCFKLNLINCILEVTGLERKKQVKVWRNNGAVKEKKNKKRTAKLKSNSTKDTETLVEENTSEQIWKEEIQLEQTVLLREEEETNILNEDVGSTEPEKQMDLEFLYLKDIVVVHTKERI